LFTPLRKTLWLSWMQLASGKRLPFACELPEACRGNNPARLQFVELAERFERQAKELELQRVPSLPAEEDGIATVGARK
jgi:hypothetical protein